ncbi:hypothetical protein Tco_0220059 [Tanacetum coccineum]
MDPPGDIMVQTSQPKRSLTPVSSGPPSIKMPTSLSRTVTTCGASTLWARSRLHEGTSIFSWQSTICQNGLKRKRSPPMMPE